MDISKSFVQDPSFNSGFIPTVAFRYYLQNSDSNDNGKRLILLELAAELRWSGHRIALSGPHLLAQGIDGGQQTAVDLTFQMPRWVVDRIERYATATRRSTSRSMSSTRSPTPRTGRYSSTRTKSIDLKLSERKWAEWLANLSYSDYWVVEIPRPKIAGYPMVDDRIRKAESHLAGRQFPEAIQDLREAWDLFNDVLKPKWSAVATMIDKGSTGQKPNHKDKSERIDDIRGSSTTGLTSALTTRGTRCSPRTHTCATNRRAPISYLRSGSPGAVSGGPSTLPAPPEVPRYAAYVMELRLQASTGKVAFDHLTEAVARRRTVGERLREIREANLMQLTAERAENEDLAREMVNLIPKILDGLQSFLVSAGITPTPFRRTPRACTESQAALAARRERGEYFRRFLEVSDESPLHQLRSRATDRRGGRVHHDEMLEDFIGAETDGELVTFQIGALRRETRGWRAGKTVRWFDDESLTVHVNGREMPLNALLEEIRGIAGRVTITGRQGLVLGTSAPGDTGLALGIRVDRDRPRPEPRRRGDPVHNERRSGANPGWSFDQANPVAVNDHRPVAPSQGTRTRRHR